MTVPSLAGFLAVALGAFGAHALEGLPADRIATWETAVLWHLAHALALLALALMPTATRAIVVARWAFATGIVLFSGSLYVLAATGTRWLGAVTPVGGVALLVGWAALAVAGRRPSS
jgi:uncharacterized membrane protein YgdD (TMEM256/DUF423 family)